MKVVRGALASALLAVAWTVTSVSGFQPVPRSVSTTAISSTATPCDAPPENIVVAPEDVTAQGLRSTVLTNVRGEKIALGEKMGKGTSIEWYDLQQKQPELFSSEENQKGINGPIFISLGDEEKLSLFLEKNPQIDPEQILIDDYSFGAYAAAGFGRFDEVDKDVAKEASKSLSFPDLGGFKGTWNYLSTAMKTAPVPKDVKLEGIPEGVFQLGGTYVVSGNNVVYRWSDRLPGDHPDVEEVLSIAAEANEKQSANPFESLELPKFFGL